MPRRHARLHHIRSGSYTDVYSDEYESDYARIVHLLGKLGRYARSNEGFAFASSVIEYTSSDTAVDDIWTAVAAVWAARDTYLTDADLKTAIDAALTAAGYTLR